jgi:hypothetical protein
MPPETLEEKQAAIQALWTVGIRTAVPAWNRGELTNAVSSSCFNWSAGNGGYAQVAIGPVIRDELKQ